MEPTLKQFRAFVAVAESGQFTRAAERLGLSQSAVSTLISQLEQNLGLRLFDRHTRLLRLTQAGAEALAVARQAVGDLDRLVENARDLNNFSRGRVSIAAGTLQAALMLPRLIRSFRDRYPNIDVTMHDVSERAVVDMVKSGQVDLGLGTVPDRDSEVLGLELTTDSFLVVMPPEHPLAQRRGLRWKDLEAETLIGPQRGNPIRERLRAELARVQVNLTLHRSFQDVSLPLTIIGMVEAGLGIAVMTSAVNPLAKSMGLVTVMPVEPIITRKISLIQRADHSLSPACRLFRDFLHRSTQSSLRNGFRRTGSGQ
ncbi:LysR family transcriptional regulator [Paracoccus kondratievae]|uniref:LysR family transcriptional regulator n=1 Tax=Paracoccus kondratievae TaxID=135740 RepID=A0AAD3NZZ1_9RHOB|nr:MULTISPECIES: LysR family transcriptional regulator [Paracoccus]QFQ89183.1 LysR family transcriptional regulator [Paracoccus kondratievae]GLK65110.1 LysR family transcriptional regulator [Paracoccus kondratievae]SMG33975.1 DNA-binding transcriptional regulator, LysR family [Paracoccus sp. J56]